MMTIAFRTIRLFGAIALCLVGTNACTGNSQPTTDLRTSEAERGSDADARIASARMTAMAKMDHDMAAAPMTGQADHDFAAMMIPHHQGAIDMAKAYLAEAKDPVMRRLAQEIVVTQ